MAPKVGVGEESFVLAERRAVREDRAAVADENSRSEAGLKDGVWSAAWFTFKNRAAAGSILRRNTDRERRSTIALRLGLTRASGSLYSRRSLSWAAQTAINDRRLGRESPRLGGRRKSGEKDQAIGRSRGGRTPKIHALTDEHRRPVAFLITRGNVADCTAAVTLIYRSPDCAVINGDKCYDADVLREPIRKRGALANIPPKVNRKEKPYFPPFLNKMATAATVVSCLHSNLLLAPSVFKQAAADRRHA